PELDPKTVDFIEEVLEEYGPLDARRLEQLTRREDPWIEAHRGIPDDEPSTATIDEEAMGVYYRQRLSEEDLKDLLGGKDGRQANQAVRTLPGHGPNPLVHGQAETGRSAG